MNDGEIDKFAIHETGSQDGKIYQPGEQIAKRAKTDEEAKKKPVVLGFKESDDELEEDEVDGALRLK